MHEIDKYDWFLNTEDDLAWRADVILNVVKEFKRFQGTMYRPGIIAYEKNSELTPWRYFTSAGFSSPAYRFRSVLLLNDEWYLVLSNQYQPGVLAPRELVREHLYEREWLEFMAITKAGGKLSVGVEQFVAHWFYDPTEVTKILPLQRLDDFMVHHSSNAYTTPGMRRHPSKPEVAINDCWMKACPIEPFLQRVSVFLNGTGDVRALLCSERCFPADLEYEGYSCAIRRVWFRSAECQDLCSA